jgi:cell division protein FtsB
LAGREFYLPLFGMLSPGRILLIAALAVVGYLCFSAGNNLVHSFRLADEEAQLREEVDELRREQEQLQQLRDYLRTDEYIQYMARRVFGLVNPGETLVIVDSPQPPQDSTDTTKLEWWQRLFAR